MPRQVCSTSLSAVLSAALPPGAIDVCLPTLQAELDHCSTAIHKPYNIHIRRYLAKGLHEVRKILLRCASGTISYLEADGHALRDICARAVPLLGTERTFFLKHLKRHGIETPQHQWERTAERYLWMPAEEDLLWIHVVRAAELMHVDATCVSKGGAHAILPINWQEIALNLGGVHGPRNCRTHFYKIRTYRYLMAQYMTPEKRLLLIQLGALIPQQWTQIWMLLDMPQWSSRVVRYALQHPSLLA